MLVASDAIAVAVWRDRRGRVSWLRIAALGFLMLPILLAIGAAFSEEQFGPRPINDLIHRAGTGRSCSS